MTESLHIKPCPVCQSSLSITHDKLEDSLTLRPENLPPLARDCLEIVTTYKRLKGLGAEWQKVHGARGIVHAGNVLVAVGAHGGQMERALGLLRWLSDQKKDYDLGTAPSFFGAYQAWTAAKVLANRSRCQVCGEGFDGTGNLCARHQ